MLVQFVSSHYRNKLGNSGEKQVGMKRFLILRFTPGDTKTVLEMIDCFFNIYPDFVGGTAFIRTADGVGLGRQDCFRIKINHHAAGRCRGRIEARQYNLIFSQIIA